MQANDPVVYLRHIRECCDRLRECLDLLRRHQAPEHILLDAACRNLEILGEASRKIGPEFRAQHPELPWREMNDLRNVLIHNYEGADPVLVWGVVEREIPALLDRTVRLLTEVGTD